MWLLLLLQLWTSTTLTTPGAYLSGNWQSCRDAEGYGERIFPFTVKGEYREFHLGPFHDFALYTTEQPDDHDHQDDGNWLRRVPTLNTLTTREWHLPELNIGVRVTEAGGSREECESYYVVVKRLK